MKLLPHKLYFLLCQLDMPKTKQETAAGGETETDTIKKERVKPFLSVYLRSESAPDSTMWLGPPNQSMAVDANLFVSFPSDQNSLLSSFLAIS